MLELAISSCDCLAQSIKVTGKFHNYDHNFNQIRVILNATGKQHSSSVTISTDPVPVLEISITNRFYEAS
jgi:hypothetical protein